MVLSVVYEDSAAAFNAAETWFGKTFNGATVFTGDNGWADYVGSVNYAIGVTAGDNAQRFWSIPLFSNTGNLHDAGTGSYNSYFVQVAKELAASQSGTGPIYVRTGWEFNSNWEPWSATTDPTDYKLAFQQFVDSFRTVSNRFQFVWCPALGGNGMDPSAAYPGDKYVDIIGQDVYYNKQYNTDPGGGATFNYDVNMQYGLQWAQDFAKAHGKATATPEWGTNANDSGTFVKDMAAWFASHNEVYQGFWDSNASFPGGQLSNGNNPAAGTAFQQAIGAITTSAPLATAQALVAAPATTVAAPVHHVSSDFDGDGKSDVVLQNAAGEVGLWESSKGTGSAGFVDLGGTSAGWNVAGVGDFDGDGKADILWRNATTGDVGLWTSGHGMNAAGFIDLGIVADQTEQIVGVGDFDGDGKADVLWMNTTTRDVGIWESSKGLAPSQTLDLGTVAAGWTVAGVGDFDGDGKADVLWRNTVTGDVGAWESGKGLGSSHFVDFGVATLNEQIVGVGDFDGDGKTDILWRRSNGELGLWESTKGVSSAHYVDLGNVSTQWQVVGVGEYEADGKTDILWHNTTTGQNSLSDASHGLTNVTATSLGSLPTGYSVAYHPEI